MIVSNALIGQITYTFTTAGATGYNGPSQTELNTAYAATNLNGLVQSLTGVQSWTVPYSGAYRIQTYGAAGGGNGGAGASMLGDFNLSAGQVLKIVVGQKGINGTGGPFGYCGGGGGGGSYVVSGTNSLLIAAGGGGGGLVGSTQGGNGLNGTSGGSVYNNGGGTGGNGGQNGISNGEAAGGGGFLTDGGNSANNNQLPCEGGKSFLNGSAGGQSGYNGSYFGGHGGFGGGGSGWNNIWNRSGGGGGYSGGQGGTWNSSPVAIAGGGGSYNSGSNQTNNSGVNSGDGEVTITLLYGVSISQTSGILCNGLTTAALSSTVNGGTPPFTYTWMPGGSNATTLSGLGAGAYTLTVKDVNDVYTESIFTITQPSIFSVSSTQTNVSCYGLTNAIANIAVSGATSPYSYTWSPVGGNAAVATGLAAGNFLINITDANNCTTSTSLNITQPSSFAVTASVNNATVCAGNTVIFTGGGAGSYVWSGGASDGVAHTPAASGSYTVVGTVGVCTSSAEIAVTVNPNPTITVSDGAVCLGQAFTMIPLGANTYTFQGGNAIVTPTTNSSYTVMGTNVYGCVSQLVATSDVTVNPLPSVSITGTNALCLGASVNLTANGASTYTWLNTSGNTSTLNVSPVVSTSYSLTGTNSFGCTGNTDIFAVTVNTLPVVSISGNAALCTGATVTLTALGATTYTWNTNSNASSIAVNPLVNTTYSLSGKSAAGCLGNTATVLVTVNSNPTIAVSSGSICTGQIYTIVPSGATTYTYQGGSAAVSPTTTTSYTVVGTDLSGCVSSIAVSNVTVNASPSISITGNNTLCAGGSVVLSANGANTYTWTNTGGTANTLTVSPTDNTTYSLTGTNALGCTGNLAVRAVTVNPNPVISVSGTLDICAGESTSLTASGASTYSWSSGNTGASAVLSPSSNSVYTIYGAFATGCNNTQLVNINVFSLPTVAISGNAVICIGDATTLTASGATTYSWSNNAITSAINVNPNTTTTYSATGTNTNGCVNTAVQTLIVNPLPIIAIYGNSAICDGDSKTLTVSGANTYSWTNGATGNLVVLSPTLSTGNYFFTVSATSSDGCLNSRIDSLLINPKPSVVIAGGSYLCSGSSMVLNASGATSYTWSNASQALSITVSPLVNTTYSVVGTSTDGCIGIALNSVTVVAIPTVVISGNNAMCVGDSRTLTAGGAITYTWNNGSTSTFIVVNPTISMNYNVVGVVTGGCNNNTTALLVVNPLPVLTISAVSNAICKGENVVLNAVGASTYGWTNNVTGYSISVSPTVTTLYTVTGTSNANCSKTGSIQITVNDCTGLQTTSQNMGIRIYPNPSNGVIKIELPENGNYSVNILNALGQIIMTQNGSGVITVDLSSFNQGLYHVSIMHGQQMIHSTSLIKQ